MAFWNRKYKDSVFTDLFGSDKTGRENFLALYNALSGNDFKLKEVSLERKELLNSHSIRPSITTSAGKSTASSLYL